MGPLVGAVATMRDPQDGEFADARRQRGRIQEVDVEPEKRLRQRGVIDERRKCVGGVPRVAAFRGQHDGQRLLDSLVPLSAGSGCRRIGVPRVVSPLSAKENHILISN